MTKRRLSPDVEPLSERRWASIEEKVLERIDAEPLRPVHDRARPSRVRRAGFAVGGVLAAAAAVALALWARPEPVRDEALLASSRVVTAGDVVHTTAGDVSIRVAPRSSLLVLERSRDTWLVSIEHGEATFSVPPRRERAPFAVEAGLVRVEVVGTRFSVAREAGTSTATVVVTEGTVRVVASGEETLVHAGERWPEAEAARSELEPVEPSAPGGDEASAESAGASSADADELAALEPSERRRRAGVRRSVTPREARSGGEVVAAPVEPAEPLGASQTDGMAAPAAPVPPAVVEPAAPTLRERFAHAESLERAAPSTALAEYAALAREGGSWGANALFAQGRLELELGHRERARALLERYLAEHPSGLNAEDARALLERSR